MTARNDVKETAAGNETRICTMNCWRCLFRSSSLTLRGKPRWNKSIHVTEEKKAVACMTLSLKIESCFN